MKKSVMTFVILPSYGHWWMTSESDSRWNNEGESIVGDCKMPEPCKRFVERKTKELGEQPHDLCWGYYKY